MAAGFKTATVNASDVPASQTDFPSYVDLSRLGITTLAEAQSVRVYADSGKVTEWAREITSAAEMHVKVPSLTSTVAMYVDWDGVRADYAVTDTYGRNSVWVGYKAVYHLQETVNNTAGGYKDATGSFDATGISMALTEVTAQIGKGQDLDGTSDYIDIPILGLLSNYRVSYWFNTDDSTADQNIVSADSSGFDDSLLSGMCPETSAISTNDKIAAIHQNSSDSSRTIVTDDTTTISNGTWYKVAIEYDGTTLELFTGGVSRATATKSGLSISNVDKWNIGQTQSTTSRRFNGKSDEVRVSDSAKGANWETAEYNNQSDEAGFWGTWSTVGGGPTASNQYFTMMGVG